MGWELMMRAVLTEEPNAADYFESRLKSAERRPAKIDCQLDQRRSFRPAQPGRTGIEDPSEA